VAIAGERGAVWLGLVEHTSQACIFLKWLDEGTASSYPLTDDPPITSSHIKCESTNDCGLSVEAKTGLVLIF
jgi:hypothetical protein